MGLSKVATAKADGTWQSQDGTTFHKIAVTLEDGTAGNCQTQQYRVYKSI